MRGLWRSYFMHKRSSGKDNAYKCISKKYSEINCENPSIGIDKLNNVIYSSIYNTSFYDFLDENKNVKTKRLLNHLDILESNLKQDNLELFKLRKQKDKLLDVFIRGVVLEPDYQSKNLKLEKSLKPYKGRILKTEKEIHYIEKHLINIKANESFDYEDVEYFKHNINKYLSYIKILDISDNKIARKFFTNKQDKILMVETNNLMNGLSVFSILSQRENFYLKVYNNYNGPMLIEKEEDLISVEEGVFYAISANRESGLDQGKEFHKTSGSKFKGKKQVKLKEDADMIFIDANLIFKIIDDLEFFALKKKTINSTIQINLERVSFQ